MCSDQERIDQLLDFIRKHDLEPPPRRTDTSGSHLFSLKVNHNLCYCQSSVANGGLECGWPNALYNPKSDLSLEYVTERHLIVNRTYTPLQGELVASQVALQNVFSNALYFKVDLYETNRSRTHMNRVTWTQDTNNLRIQKCGKHLVGMAVCDVDNHIVRMLKPRWSMPLQVIPTSGCIQHDERLFVVRLSACTAEGVLLEDCSLNVETVPFRNVSNYHISRAMQRVSNSKCVNTIKSIGSVSTQVVERGALDDDSSSTSTFSLATTYKRKR